MRQQLLVVPVLFCVLLSTGQRNPEPWENIHLHFNKTTFLKGERLWFTAYIQDQKTQRPSVATTTLHLGVYSKDGEEIKRKLLYVANGISQGDIAIDSTFTGEEYTVMAWTQYMRNFPELLPYRQNIKVFDGGFSGTEELDNDIEIAVFPEGGVLIEGAYNQIGIMVTDGLGKGVALNDLELVDNNGKVLRSKITTNRLGQGKTGFLPEQDETYSLRLQNGVNTVVSKKLPKAIPGQIGMNVENNGKEKILFKLVAAEETFKKKAGASFSLAIYQDDFMVFEEVQIDKDEAVVALNRTALPYGVNAAVLLSDSLEPIAWRLFFNHRKQQNRTHTVVVEHCLSEFGDSLQVDLILPEGVEDGIRASLSVLPEAASGYNPAQSIISSFLVQPYLQQQLPNGRYYFQDINRRKRYELDKQLLIEGWGKYDWDTRTLEKAKLEFEMETGIPIQGKVIDANLIEEQQVFLFSQQFGDKVYADLGQEKDFSTVMNLFENDSLGVSLIGKKGKLRKPRVELGSIGFIKLDLNTSNWLVFNQIDRLSERQPETDQAFNLSKRTIALEEVTVTEKALAANKYQFTAGIEGRQIRDEDIKKYRSVLNYFRKLGYRVTVANGQVVVQSYNSPFPVAPVSINGMPATAVELMNMSLSSVQFITYNKSWLNPFIAMSINPDYVAPENRNRFIKFAIENGYARPQEYFRANYPDYDSALFKNFGALDWKASLWITSEIPTSITVPLHNQKGVKLYLEGMGQKGGLVSMAEEIAIDSE